MTCEKPRSTSGSGEERRRGARVGPDEHPHLVDAVAGEPVNERVVGLQRLSVAAEDGVFPFRRPAVDANAELLLELYVPASGFENGSDRTEQSVYSGVVARCANGARKWKTNPLVNNELSASLSSLMIAWVILFTVVTFACSLMYPTV